MSSARSVTRQTSEWPRFERQTLMVMQATKRKRLKSWGDHGNGPGNSCQRQYAPQTPLPDGTQRLTVNRSPREHPVARPYQTLPAHASVGSARSHSQPAVSRT
jgi:hypothetical protein